MMVTVAIIGILAAIAYPSYMDTVRRSNRAEAITELTDIAQRLQRCYSSFGRYDDPANLDRCSVYEALTEGDGFITTRGRGYYRITIAAPAAPATTATGYILRATAVLQPQLADRDGCDAMTLNSLGVKGPIVPPAVRSPCW